MNHEKALALVKEKKIVAILRNIPLEDSLSVAHALYAGGIRVMEFTYDHALPGFMEINSRQVESVCREFGNEMLVGCGTALTVEEGAVRLIRNGNSVPMDVCEGEFRVYGPDGEFLMLGRGEKGHLRTIKSFFEV